MSTLVSLNLLDLLWAGLIGYYVQPLMTCGHHEIVEVRGLHCVLSHILVFNHILFTLLILNSSQLEALRPSLQVRSIPYFASSLMRQLSVEWFVHAALPIKKLLHLRIK